MSDNGSQCKVTMDGTDFRIMEPSPFDPKWLSEKLNGPGVKYEVAVCIQTGWIVHTHGPFPCGQWHDLTIARDDLSYKLAASHDRKEIALADGGYADGYNLFETPTGHNNWDQRMKAQARAQQETINRRFKMWSMLGQRFRGKPDKHEKYFLAVANLTQFLIMTSGFDDDERKLLQVEYNDMGGTTTAVNNILMADDDSDEDDDDDDDDIDEDD
jgi:DDE superfamily endonuclease